MNRHFWGILSAILCGLSISATAQNLTREADTFQWINIFSDRGYSKRIRAQHNTYELRSVKRIGGNLVDEFDSFITVLDRDSNRVKWEIPLGYYRKYNSTPPQAGECPLLGIPQQDTRIALICLNKEAGKNPILQTYDTETGNVVSEVELPLPLLSTVTFVGNTLPFKDGVGYVYMSENQETLGLPHIVAFNIYEGSVAWSYRPIGKVNNVRIIDEDVLLQIGKDASSSQMIARINNRTGQLKWEMPIPNTAELLVKIEGLLITAHDGTDEKRLEYYQAVDFETMNPVWSYATECTKNSRLVTSNNGVFYAVCVIGDKWTLHAIDLDTGRNLWKTEFQEDGVTMGRYDMRGLYFINNQVWVEAYTSSYKKTVEFRFDSQNGKLVNFTIR